MMQDMFKVNGIKLPSPTLCSYKLADLSSDESGRSTYTGAMQKDIISQKRTLSCRWDRLTWEEAATLAGLCKYSGVTVRVTYPDLSDGCYNTRSFYTGDFEADYGYWTDREHWVTNVACHFIEV